MNTRYVITHVNWDGMRQMTDSMQGRYTYETKEKAQSLLESFLLHNPKNLLSALFGEQSVGTFAVRSVDCYDSGDPKTMWFQDDEPRTQELEEIKAFEKISTNDLNAYYRILNASVLDIGEAKSLIPRHKRIVRNILYSRALSQTSHASMVEKVLQR